MLSVSMNRPETDPHYRYQGPLRLTDDGACDPNTRSMKLSPNSVVGHQGASTPLLDIKLQIPSRKQGLNLPPIHTPHQHSRKPSRKPSPMCIPPQGLCPPLVPPIPRPSPISSNSVAWRVQSDTSHLRGRNSKNNKGNGTGTNNRRSIFGLYFADQSDANRSNRSYSGDGTSMMYSRDATSSSPRPAITSSPRPTPTQHKRSSSGSILETAILHPEPLDYRMFAPPPEHATKSAICGRFSSLEEEAPAVFLDLERKSLPPLPSPLQRFYSEPQMSSGPPSNMHGMYPLMTPISILRQSSFCSSPNTSGVKDRWKTAVPSLSFNLTGSFRLPSHSNGNVNAKEAEAPSTVAARVLDKQRCGSSISEDASTPSSVVATPESPTPDIFVRTVRFDPRVTVTEFEDPVERVWYDEFELERLKRETILLAQEYMLTHPMEAERYQRAKLDPVTGTYRKRAVFSLPALSASTVSSEGDESDSGLASRSEMSAKELQEVCNSQVKRILIVDPNPAIATLFCKSMTSMFPTAELITAQSAERALKLVNDSLVGSVSSKFEQTRNAFDIIVIEQSLYPYSPLLASRKREPLCGESRTDTGRQSPTGQDQRAIESTVGGGGGREGTGMTSNNSMPDLSIHASGHSGCHFPELLKLGSFFQQPEAPSPRKECVRAREPRCGADLIQSIVRLQQQQEIAPPSVGSSTPNVSSPFEWKALVIGVSVQPDRDARILQQAGADVIWGKPIPRVGNALRNQLLKALLAKRRVGRLT